MTSEPFGTTTDDQPVDRIQIGAGRLRVAVLTWGAVLHDVRLQGHPHSLVLTAPELAPYEGPMSYFGSVIGPVVNRITNARAPIGGRMHQFEANQDGRHLLHSGSVGTHLKVWRIAAMDEASVTLALTLPDGEGGFPGNREIEVTYRIDAPACLTMTIKATTDQTTLMNVAGHSYWNLTGADTFEGHQLQINAGHMLPTDSDGLPTGEVLPVDGTVYDFRELRLVEAATPPLDNNFCLTDHSGELRAAAHFVASGSVAMALETTEPGLQVYDARNTDEAGFAPYAGIALEAQRWPDAPNNAGFPSISIEPDQTYRQVTRMTFSDADT
ncbi:aldose epimerase family protein [Aliiroseovarius sp. YM-037]|uniref:aldose epimerase family protein n=1 Tax=Aliiroseovarius sp. YM-037 TaxID=3341728 RepID=UPI003A7FA50E